MSRPTAGTSPAAAAAATLCDDGSDGRGVPVDRRPRARHLRTAARRVGPHPRHRRGRGAAAAGGRPGARQKRMGERCERGRHPAATPRPRRLPARLPPRSTSRPSSRPSASRCTPRQPPSQSSPACPRAPSPSSSTRVQRPTLRRRPAQVVGARGGGASLPGRPRSSVGGLPRPRCPPPTLKRAVRRAREACAASSQACAG